MSATEILDELRKLSASELRAIRERLLEMEKIPSRSTLADFARILRTTPADAEFANDLETVNRADGPLANPWAS